jgi:uncharacterized phage protein gp47/JayE
MAYARPTLEELVERSVGDVSSRSRGSAYIKRSMERVLATVQAGMAHGTHGHLEHLAKQITPLHCDEDMLAEWASLLTVPRNPATKATRFATFTGTDTTELPLDTALQAADGSGWTVITGGVVAGGEVTVEIEADDAGADGNLDGGAQMSLVTPIAGIDTDGVIAEDDNETDGSDLEEVEDWRVRVVDEFRSPQSGGGPGDYEAWALANSGVTRAWELGNRMGVGTVTLVFVRDDDATIDPPEDYVADDIVPSSGEITTVEDYIDARRPIDMRAFYVSAPVLAPVDMTIAISPNTAAVQKAVRAELIEFFRLEAELEEEMEQSLVDEAISLATGEDSHEITAITSLDPGALGLLVLGDVTFTTLV